MDFSKRLSEFRIELSDKQLNQFEEYFTLLAEWNEKMNLTAITEREDVYLKGDTFLDHVDYWIAFIGGLYGIHDAQWRSEFGGTIYKKDGSHGCVNMPLNNMKKLYEKVKVGTAVNIYN